MLKLTILAIGKHKESWVKEAVEHYRKLLSKHVNLKVKIISPPPNSGSLPPSALMKAEADKISKELGDKFVVILSDQGIKHDSHSFSRLISKWQNSGKSNIIMVIGGAFGLDKSLIARADYRLSLSEMTMSHQVVRIMLLEQLFRAFGIIKGTDYHK